MIYHESLISLLFSELFVIFQSISSFFSYKGIPFVYNSIQKGEEDQQKLLFFLDYWTISFDSRHSFFFTCFPTKIKFHLISLHLRIIKVCNRYYYCIYCRCINSSFSYSGRAALLPLFLRSALDRKNRSNAIDLGLPEYIYTNIEKKKKKIRWWPDAQHWTHPAGNDCAAF